MYDELFGVKNMTPAGLIELGLIFVIGIVYLVIVFLHKRGFISEEAMVKILDCGVLVWPAYFVVLIVLEVGRRL